MEQCAEVGHGSARVALASTESFGVVRHPVVQPGLRGLPSQLIERRASVGPLASLVIQNVVQPYPPMPARGRALVRDLALLQQLDQRRTTDAEEVRGPP